jgi:hypothetical protein
MAIKPVSKESKYSGENGKTGWSSIGILESGKKETPPFKNRVYLPHGDLALFHVKHVWV